MKTNKRAVIFSCIFLIIGLNSLFSQVTTAAEVKNELNDLWDRYVAFTIPLKLSNLYFSIKNTTIFVQKSHKKLKKSRFLTRFLGDLINSTASLEYSSRHSDILRQFGDRFLGVLNGAGDEDMQGYLFMGRLTDMYVLFLGGNDGFAEYMAEQEPNEYFLTTEENKDVLRIYIKRWQKSNGINGIFF